MRAILDERNLESSAGLAQELGIRRVIGRHAELESDGREKATIIPVRCFSCGNLIGDKWEEFAKRVKAGEVAGKVLDHLGLTRYCCRRMLLSHVEIIDEIIKFYEKGNVENGEETA